jgi:hypothetical protein
MRGINKLIQPKINWFRLILLYFLFASTLVAAEDNFVSSNAQTIEEMEKELIANGYVLCDQFYIDVFAEHDRFLRAYKGRKPEIYVVHRTKVNSIIYHFVFLLKDYPNITLGADIVDDNDKIIKQYIKVNTHEEMPNLWLTCDLNKDGVIDENEGHIAWW